MPNSPKKVKTEADSSDEEDVEEMSSDEEEDAPIEGEDLADNDGSEDEEEDDELPTTSTAVFLNRESSIPNPKEKLEISQDRKNIPPGKILEILSALKKKPELANVPLDKIPDRHFRLKTEDDKIYKTAHVKKEVMRYWKMAALSEVITLQDVISITHMFLRTGKALKMYADFPGEEPPMGVYKYFVYKERAKITEQHPNLGLGQITKKMAEAWHDMSDEDKDELGQEYEVVVKKYHDDMIAFFKRHPNLKAAGDAFEAQVAGRPPPPPPSTVASRKRFKATPAVTGLDVYKEQKGARYAEKYELSEDSAELAKKIEKKYNKLSEERKAEFESEAQKRNKAAKTKNGQASGAALADALMDAGEEAAKNSLKQKASKGASATSNLKMLEKREAKKSEAARKEELARKAMPPPPTIASPRLTDESSNLDSGTDGGGTPGKRERKRKRRERRQAEEKARKEAENVEKTLNSIGLK